MSGQKPRRRSSADELPPRPLKRNSSQAIRAEEGTAAPRGGASVGAAGALRDAIFPIYGQYEVTKFLSLGAIKFFVVFVLTLTRDTKDTLVVTQCGAEAIAFLKVYGVLPSAAAFIALYNRMSQSLPRRALFYSTCIPFFFFFLLFDAAIFPNAAAIQPAPGAVLAAMRRLAGRPSLGQRGGAAAVVASILTHWTSALFYVVSEVYSSVSVGILFWQHANDVVGVAQAKRFYPLFGQMSSLAPIVAGQYVVRYASRAGEFGESMHRLTHAITISGIAICVMYHFSNEYIKRNEPPNAKDDAKAAKKKKKPKMTMVESAKFLGSSQYLRLVATLVIGYGLSINFTEIIWKSLVKKAHPDPVDYQRFMGNFSSAVGLATFLVIFAGGNVIKHLGWRVGAVATPTTMAALAAPFFLCVLLGGTKSGASLKAAVLVGAVQSLLSKATKYALFDPTLQMAYIPLDDESKVRGKAAIDVLGSRVGKSGGSLVLQGLVVAFGSAVDAAPAVAAVFYAVLFAWIRAANKLSVLFAEASGRNVKES